MELKDKQDKREKDKIESKFGSDAKTPNEDLKVSGFMNFGSALPNKSQIKGKNQVENSTTDDKQKL